MFFWDLTEFTRTGGFSFGRGYFDEIGGIYSDFKARCLKFLISVFVSTVFLAPTLRNRADTFDAFACIFRL